VLRNHAGLRGLDYAHNKRDAQGRALNLVHRDVSPQNVLIGFEGEVKLIDFGIAKAAGKASKTQAGILKGKFGYMSPEQVRGLPSTGAATSSPRYHSLRDAHQSAAVCRRE